nr:hypothetical protein [uncultured Roseococcus sp.]
MRRTASICLFLAAALGAFAWWGLLTTEGSRRFDEMDGMIPFAAGVLSALLALGGVIAWAFSGMRRRR